MDAYEGWAPDPFAAHEARYFVDGRPTRLVRDGTVESFDEPPHAPPVEASSALFVEPSASPVEPATADRFDQTLHEHGHGPDETVQADHAVAPDQPVAPPPPGTSYWSPPPPPRPVEIPTGDFAFGGPRLAVGPADTFVGGSEPPPTRRSRKLLVAAVVALVVVASAAAVVVVGSGKSAEAAVIDSVNSTIADRSAHVSVDMAIQGPSSSLSGTGSGGIDFSQNALQLQLAVSAAGESVQMQVLYVAGSVYEALPGLDQLAPGKSWISLDISSLEGPASKGDPGALSTGDNPAATLRLLTQQGNTVVGLGPSTVDGVGVQGYSVALSAATIKAQLASANVPSWLKSALSGVDINGITDKVYVDSSGLLRRYSMDLTETVPSKGTVTVHETLDFSDYGTPVSITPPPPDQVLSLDQFLQDLQSAVASRSTS